MHHLYRKGAQGIVSLLDKLDAWRRPERIEPFVLCCMCDFLGRKGFENRPFPRAQYFLSIFSICRNVKAKEFVEEGFKGKDIADKMFSKRVELVEDYIKTLPEEELNDSSNEKPANVKEKVKTYERKPQNKLKIQKGFFKLRLNQN